MITVLGYRALCLKSLVMSGIWLGFMSSDLMKIRRPGVLRVRDVYRVTFGKRIGKKALRYDVIELRGSLCVDNHMGRNSARICIHTCVSARYGIVLRLRPAGLVDDSEARGTSRLEAFLGLCRSSGKHLYEYSVAYP